MLFEIKGVRLIGELLNSYGNEFLPFFHEDNAQVLFELIARPPSLDCHSRKLDFYKVLMMHFNSKLTLLSLFNHHPEIGSICNLFYISK